MAATKKKLIAVSRDMASTRQMGRVVAPLIDLLPASSPTAAMEMMEDPSISAIMVDAQGGLDAMELLEHARDRKADVRRILLTGVEDLTRVIEGLHSGTVQRVVYKPMTPAAIVAAVCATQMAA